LARAQVLPPPLSKRNQQLLDRVHSSNKLPHRLLLKLLSQPEQALNKRPRSAVMVQQSKHLHSRVVWQPSLALI
jgi:hypothetical protein